MSVRFCMFTGICFVLALTFRAGEAATQDNLAECRLASTDSFSFKQCIGLQHQVSETLLADIENSWREYLALESNQVVADGPSKLVDEVDSGAGTSGIGKTNNSSASTTTVPDAVSDAESKNADPSSVGKIIAIVNDETVSGSDSEGEVINISNQALLEPIFQYWTVILQSIYQSRPSERGLKNWLIFTDNSGINDAPGKRVSTVQIRWICT